MRGAFASALDYLAMAKYRFSSSPTSSNWAPALLVPWQKFFLVLDKMAAVDVETIAVEISEDELRKVRMRPNNTRPRLRASS